MSAVFADTFYLLAVVNRHDPPHQRCVRFFRQFLGNFVTTAWVLVEVADAWAAPPNRMVAAGLITQLPHNPRFRIIPPSQSLLDRGFELYVNRPDKEWSLTDCMSFVVMRDENISEALTGDHHFEQAGFTILLKQQRSRDQLLHHIAVHVSKSEVAHGV